MKIKVEIFFSEPIWTTQLKPSFTWNLVLGLDKAGYLNREKVDEIFYVLICSFIRSQTSFS